ncbi:hypothetical protein [Corynebacterium coyleae]|uniref:hypothetical protein n=1 Tax=Corynebacterium coyleae TaxID=53374 RepID=UPI0025505D06|nr:hypothetical protein [Corynebacterium coyleae]MDK8241703.1 hypothetical protein [Corynebacterium coyleae]
MSSFDGLNTHKTISTYLLAHPTPWRLVESKQASPHLEGLHLYWEPNEDGHEGVLYRQGRDVTSEIIVDAEGRVVVETQGNDDVSWFGGDMRSLVDFVNAVGAALRTIAQVEARQKVHDWFKVRAGTLSEADKQRIMESSKRRLSGPVDEFLPCETDNKGSKETEE